MQSYGNTEANFMLILQQTQTLVRRHNAPFFISFASSAILAKSTANGRIVTAEYNLNSQSSEQSDNKINNFRSVFYPILDLMKTMRGLYSIWLRQMINYLDVMNRKKVVATFFRAFT